MNASERRTPLRIHVLQHVPFEGPGAIADWAAARGHALTIAHVYEGDLPSLDAFDLLAVMGGPMNVYEESAHPWLAAEKEFLGASVAAGKSILGICLGAQLLSVVLGGEVVRGDHMEIGWFPVKLTEEGRAARALRGFPPDFTALHWHGDTFSIPPGATHVAASAACRNQAFTFDDGRVAGLQFHLEETRESLSLLVENASADLVPGEWIQTQGELLSAQAPFADCRDLLFQMLDQMSGPAPTPSAR